MNRIRILLAVLVLFAIVGATVYFFILDGNGNGDEFPSEVAEQSMGDLVLDQAAIGQEGEAHEVAPGLFHDEVQDLALEPGEAVLMLRYTNEDGDPASGRTIIYVDDQGNETQAQLSDEGEVVFPINLGLGDDGQARLNTFSLRVGDDERQVSLNVIPPIDNGLTGGDMVNTPGELGVEPEPDQPRTVVDLEVSDVFLDAFAEYCGFSPGDVKKVRLEPNDKPRFQVAWSESGFVQARSVIPVGQPIWVLISEGGDKCRINPPCGNPEVPKGKLPEAPPGGEVPPPPPPDKPPKKPPTPTNTPVPGASPTPTKTLPPGVTPTDTPVTPPTSTPTRTPTNTPPGNTPTRTPTNTPVTPDCLVTILGPSRVDNTSTHARMQATAQWDRQPNFTPTIQWFLDGTFVGGGQSIQFSATLNVNHVLTVKVLSGNLVICQDAASFREGSIPPGNGPTRTPTSTSVPAPTPTTDPDDGYMGPQ